MSPFEDFDLDLLKIGDTSGASPLDVDTSGSGNTTESSELCSTFATFLSRGTSCLVTCKTCKGKC